MKKLTFAMAGGGTGGHVIPLIAVARELRGRGHDVFFVGTREGLEGRLVPKEHFPIEFITIGGLKRVGMLRTLRTLWQLPLSVARCLGILRKRKPAGVFSLGGYVAGPVTLAAWLIGIPIVLMEPNAMPGMANRKMARFVKRALVSFEPAGKYFPSRKVEVSGLPVRAEFFSVPKKTRSGELTVLLTGGSRGSHRLNEAAKASWRLFREQQVSVKWIHQTGRDEFESMQRDFAEAGANGRIVPFLDDMPAAFAESDLIVCRSGAGAVAEVAAAGKPAIFVPFPFAADDHQLKNAEVLATAGAAKLIADRDFTGSALFDAVTEITGRPGVLEEMGEKARQFAHQDAAQRAASILEQEAARSGADRG